MVTFTLRRPAAGPHLYPITSRSSQLITGDGELNKRHPVRIGFLVTTRHKQPLRVP